MRRSPTLMIVLLVWTLWLVTAHAGAPGAVAVLSQTRQHNTCIPRDRVVARFRAVAAGTANTTQNKRSTTSLNDLWNRLDGCDQVGSLTKTEVRALVDVFYNAGNAALLTAIRQQRSAMTVDTMIADAYTRAPDRVQDDPALAARTSLALIAVNRNYNVAYQDLAFATVYGAADPALIRGYLQHFGCRKTDAVWAALTSDSRAFIPGEAFPATTHVDDWSRSDLVKARLALLQEHVIPPLSTDCPLSDGYSYANFDMTEYLFGLGKTRALGWGGDISEHAATWGAHLRHAWNSGLEKADADIQQGMSTFWQLMPGTSDPDSPASDTDRDTPTPESADRP